MTDTTDILLGTDVKFLLTLTVPGFDQDEDDWQVELLAGSNVVKTYAKTDLVRGDDGWILPIETQDLRPTQYDIKVTAYVNDYDFPEGVRTEIYKQNLMRVTKK